MRDETLTTDRESLVQICAVALMHLLGLKEACSVELQLKPTYANIPGLMCVRLLMGPGVLTKLVIFVMVSGHGIFLCIPVERYCFLIHWLSVAEIHTCVVLIRGQIIDSDNNIKAKDPR